MSEAHKIVSIGNYRLQANNLGKGTFARVELASHVVLKKEVALKIIVKSQIKDPYMRKHLHREASILSRLNHPNIVKLVEICKSTDIYCLVLEYISGGTLFDHVQNRGNLSESEARHMSRQLIAAVAYLHKERILHRDLKLENILLDNDRLVLIDFGLSNTWYPGKIMHTHCGSAEYASPELFLKDVPYGSSVDVWSFGIILYTMTMGHLPFQIESNEKSTDGALPVLIKKIMKGLVNLHHKEMNRLTIDCRVLIMRCLDTNPNTRISVKAITSDPWIGYLRGRSLAATNGPASDESKKIASDIKQLLNIKLSAEEILFHVRKRKYGTTAGCFNLIRLDYIKRSLDSHDYSNKNFEALPLQIDSTEKAPCIPVESNRYFSDNQVGDVSDIIDMKKQRSVRHNDVKDELLKKSTSCDVPQNEGSQESHRENQAKDRRSRSQDSKAPPSWRRSFLNIPSTGRISFSRLKRVDTDREEISKQADSGILRMFGQKALEDITNSVRPLLRRHSKRESNAKFDTLPKSTTQQQQYCLGASVEVKTPMLPKSSFVTKKLRNRAVRLEERIVVPKKPIR